MKNLKDNLKQAFDEAPDKVAFLNEIRSFLHELSPMPGNPVDYVQWIRKEEVVANDYNPNHVAPKELDLLHTSIREDGYTQPIVVVRDEEKGKYVIVDGFHRNLVLRKYQDIHDRCHGYLPVVVLDKDIKQRMAATVRHNRARGSHSVDGMFNIVYRMMKEGATPKQICFELGLEEKEFVKIKYVTGFAKIFKNYEFSKAIDKAVKTHGN